MVSAIVLMNVERNLINDIANALVEIDGVSEVYSVAGRVDLVCVIRVPSNERLAAVVTEHMLQIEGIIDSETLISFRVFSQHDLESMFSIGH
ncbi:MAG: Lrp/AsnC ligand binding domain-containing protein [Anaerolineales bacterium]|nr:Lrp/AsnC ligand binding domain-containing protein [Anaerolineales bacterium]MCA9928003.1 Lrp/AsnC ligand binding domain-containing protein [Anaerolineales bacterium]